MATSFLSYNLTNYHHGNTKLHQAHAYDPLSCHLAMPKYNNKLSFSVNQQSTRRNLKVVQAIPETADGFLALFPADTPWYAWAGAAMVAVPLAIQRIVKLTNQVEAAAETVEGIADAVGKVADQIDAAADQLAEKLPEGKLKDMVVKVDRIVEATSREAQKVEDLMDKVEEMSNEIEDFIVERTKKEDAAKKDAANATSETK